MYRVYKVDAKCALEKRGGTDGYQPKFIVDNGDTFLKVQCKMAGYYVDDWRVEDIASRVCQQLGFYNIVQTPCIVKLSSTPVSLHGVYSRNIEKLGKQYFSFESALNKYGLTLRNNTTYNRLSSTDKLRWLASKAAECIPNIQCSEYIDYLLKIAIIDILVCNVDRHTRNFGYVFNSHSGKNEIAPIFDCGMGLFESDIHFKQLSTFEECLRYCYIEPYSEDPFTLLEDLDREFRVRAKLHKQLSNIKINKQLFTSQKAYSYFTEVLRRLRG